MNSDDEYGVDFGGGQGMKKKDAKAKKNVNTMKIEQFLEHINVKRIGEENPNFSGNSPTKRTDASNK